MIHDVEFEQFIKPCLVEVGADRRVVRIFKSTRAAYKWLVTEHHGALLKRVEREVAVKQIREQIWERCGGICEKCSINRVTWDSGQMHEKQHRGKGGDISLENSIFICRDCHDAAHHDRRPRFGERVEKG